MSEIKLNITKGCHPGYGSEWWTEEDWQKWREHEAELKRSGEYGKEIEVTVNVNPTPILDHPEPVFENAGYFIPYKDNDFRPKFIKWRDDDKT